MHLSEGAFKLYIHAFVYNYSSEKREEGDLIVALWGTPLLSDPIDTYAEMSKKKHPFKLLHNCLVDYDVSVKLTTKPLITVEITNTTIH